MRTLASLCQKIGVLPGREAANRHARRAQALLGFCFAAGFTGVSAKAIHYAAFPGEMPVLAASGAPPVLAKSRPDIVDRNGRLLATDIRVYWLAANPREIPHADEAAEKLAALFPDLDQAALSRKFHDKSSRFEWVKRGLVPDQAQAVQMLGIPGLTILATVQRAYPSVNDAAQIIGTTNVDNEGIAGVEKYIDRQLAAQVTPVSLAKRPIVRLSLDLGVQHAFAAELAKAMQRYRAEAALGLVLDVRNGEVLASVSLPDFDPNRREQTVDDNRRNRVVNDIYELGSVFKSFTIAMALDQDVASRYERFDTSPLRLGHFLLHDPHAAHAPMTVEDIFIHSSNMGTARIAEAAGIARQRRFLESLGLFEKLETEAGMARKPVIPGVWRPANAMTIAYGHGIAVPPILFASAMAAIVNGGVRVKPTFLLAEGTADDMGERVIRPETSAAMRDLMRLTVQRGTGRRAAVDGFDIGGKTGTALKVKEGRYTHDVVNSFVAVLPASDPRYLVLVTLDEPKPGAQGNMNEAAYNAAPAAGAIIKRIGSMLDVVPAPRFDEIVATSYEQADSNRPQRAVIRKSPYETSGSDQGYSAYRQRERASSPGYSWANGR
jgi:cell division protein FtsI (penicillin-binding protein 3)